MKSPFTGGDVILVYNDTTTTFRKEEFKYTYICCKCVDTGETFTTTEIDEVNVAQVYNAYRSKHGIPFPDEIKMTRSRYSLSASKMSKILGFGDNQYRLYENGEMPNIGNGKLLKAIQDPRTFETFLNGSKDILNENDYNLIKDKIRNYTINESEQDFTKRFIFGDSARSSMNGYALQSVSKLKNVMLFFIEKFNGVFFTMMNKLLFYSDFLSYKSYGIGITGLRYKAIQYGPVPVRFDKVYSGIEDISQDIVETKNGNIGNKIVSNMSFDKECLTERQIDILEKVYDAFKNYTSLSISDKSHKETAWVNNIHTHSLIDYKFAFSLQEI